VDGPIGLAVSGGPDSLGLLLLAAAAIPGRFEVATVNHGLRAEAADECALVERVCADRGIACATLTVTVAPGNVQDRARAARYAALGAWAQDRGLMAVATAHHADDQAETLLMRLNRSSGLAGLAGIRARAMVVGCPVPVVRPLLGFRRAELAAIAQQAGLPAASDPSNHDTRFDRVRMREWLARQDVLDPAALARSAALLTEAEETFAAMADQAWEDGVQRSTDGLALPVSRWREINLRLLERALATLSDGARRSEIASLLDLLESDGAQANLAGVMVARRGGQFVCRPEPPRRAVTK
jgi:tRNA(Ile)-lysidine synthase